jgi:CheY-like chemotaxis protein
LPFSDVNGILVVDDEGAVRADISEFLRERGFRVMEASSAAEAIEILSDSSIGRVDSLNPISIA